MNGTKAMGLKLFGWRRRTKQTGEEALPQHLLVPFANTNDDREVLRQAIEWARVFDSKLSVLCLAVVPRSVALDNCPHERLLPSETFATAAREIAEEMGYRDLEIIVCPVHNFGYALVQKVQELKVDLVMMAVDYHQRRAEFTMDDTLSIVVHNVPCQLWLYGTPEEDE